MFLIVFCVIVYVRCAQKIILKEPIAENQKEQTEFISLAQQEQFKYFLSSNSISNQVIYTPPTQKDCYLQPAIFSIKSLMKTNLLIDSKIAQIILLPLKQKIFVADQSFNLISFSTDEHFLLRNLSPKICLSKNVFLTNAIAATQDQNFIFYITPSQYFIIKTDSLNSVKNYNLPRPVIDVQKTIIFNKRLILISKTNGLFVYRFLEDNLTLELNQQINNDFHLIDIKIAKKYLFVLDEKLKDLLVYQININTQKKNIQFNKKSQLIFYDIISLKTITSQKFGATHLSLQIYDHGQYFTLMILFEHESKNIIAQIKYSSIQKKYSFVRYYKFDIGIKSMHLNKNNLLVLGNQSLGYFPYNIHPRLLSNAFNGFFTMNFFSAIKVIDNSHLIAVRNNLIEYMNFSIDGSKLVCTIKQNSILTSIQLRGNKSNCREINSYQQYCSFQKTFIIKRMEITLNAPLAQVIFFSIEIFLILFGIGLCIIYFMQQKKQKTIKRFQLFFQQKKRTEDFPMSSDRRVNIVI